VDSTVKRNGSSKPDFDVPAKLREKRLDRGPVGALPDPAAKRENRIAEL
jgi:hypothetical protein